MKRSNTIDCKSIGLCLRGFESLPLHQILIMKKVILIHGCPSDAEKAMSPETRTYDKHWMPWLKKQLNDRGVKVEAPLMPNPWAPVYEDFKAEFAKLAVDQETILVGHSCGCAFLVNWLGETRQKIAKLILVAPWKIPRGKDQARVKFYGFRIDEDIKNMVGSITMFISDDEVEEGKESLEIYKKALGGKVVQLHGKGHFTLKGMETEEFPELLKEITND